MAKREILDGILKALERMGIEEALPEASLMEDLGLESLEVFQLLANLEGIFSIRIPERILMRVDTVQDLADELAGLMER